MKEKILVYFKYMIGVVIVYAIGILTGWLEGISFLELSLGLLGIIFFDIVQWLYKKIKPRFFSSKSRVKD